MILQTLIHELNCKATSTEVNDIAHLLNVKHVHEGLQDQGLVYDSVQEADETNKTEGRGAQALVS